jgi:hypothetical protein
VFGVQYVDGKGNRKVKDFPTEAAREKWIDANDDVEILATSDEGEGTLSSRTAGLTWEEQPPIGRVQTIRSLLTRHEDLVGEVTAWVGGKWLWQVYDEEITNNNGDVEAEGEEDSEALAKMAVESYLTGSSSIGPDQYLSHKRAEIPTVIWPAAYVPRVGDRVEYMVDDPEDRVQAHGWAIVQSVSDDARSATIVDEDSSEVFEDFLVNGEVETIIQAGRRGGLDYGEEPKVCRLCGNHESDMTYAPFHGDLCDPCFQGLKPGKIPTSRRAGLVPACPDCQSTDVLVDISLGDESMSTASCYVCGWAGDADALYGDLVMASHTAAADKCPTCERWIAQPDLVNGSCVEARDGQRWCRDHAPEDWDEEVEVEPFWGGYQLRYPPEEKQSRAAAVSVRKSDADAVFNAVKRQFAGWIDPSLPSGGPILEKDWDFLGYGAIPYAIVWEDGPYEWAFIAIHGGREQEFGGTIPPVEIPSHLYTEPITSWALGIYPGITASSRLAAGFRSRDLGDHLSGSVKSLSNGETWWQVHDRISGATASGRVKGHANAGHLFAGVKRRVAALAPDEPVDLELIADELGCPADPVPT